MSNDKMRKEFEALFPTPMGIWWSPEGGKDGGRYMTEIAHVGCVYHQGRWEGFKASRESLVVELPFVRSYPAHEASSDVDYYIDEGKHEMRGECRRAIESLGLRVKP